MQARRAKRNMSVLKKATQPIPIRTAEAIQALIRERGLKAGDALPAQRQLADHLGVSRPSLREALSILETLGLISVEAGRGVYVIDPATRAAAPAQWRYNQLFSLRDVYQTRLAIEGLAAALTAATIHGGVIAEFDAISSVMDAAAERRDGLALADADTRFHDLIFSLCGNAMFQKLYQDIRTVFVESQRIPMTERERLSETAAEHRRVLEAFAARQPEAARRAMESHILNSAARAGLTIL
ncbi:FadR family transcriptional regulator [Xanthobacter dioxanivorans]|uniref:FadR family transcriptional regulator n=1 Tax=Xanthobacter dioxanivorans TaxID=2528964 RepID=A0A974SIS1_9HYPH|nr:FCD domain-containing protein [Xanthobacter dioxanivorans]QRG05648.1 FadR family transcriptional regulator [Xanthobacter dioxanivorans]